MGASGGEMLNQRRLAIFQDTVPEEYRAKLRNRITVLPISNTVANDIAVKFHYLHRARTGGRQLSYGVFFDGILKGILVYADPTFHSKHGLIPPLRADEVIELARMWLDDDCPKHSETCALGKTLRELRRDWYQKYSRGIKAVISFSDLEYGYEGTIYKGANFRNCGFARSARFADAGMKYSRTDEGWGAGHYSAKQEKQSAPRTGDTKRLFLYVWDKELDKILLREDVED